jgi:hypothetical protein
MLRACGQQNVFERGQCCVKGIDMLRVCPAVSFLPFNECFERS